MARMVAECNKKNYMFKMPACYKRLFNDAMKAIFETAASGKHSVELIHSINCKSLKTLNRFRQMLGYLGYEVTQCDFMNHPSFRSEAFVLRLKWGDDPVAKNAKKPRMDYQTLEPVQGRLSLRP